ncbi:two component transcriptional regulator, winged helix family [Thermincola ferriacetica]|uniref:Stage 0 sporulation protein A homolog n=2 Tax=Thermincola TaxID=278993 RepID=D5XAL8_THEPJ|nr:MULTISPECIES: response regulator transcription factor [Thermincola]ADG83222.1 two component transcriptional regulator, winged helix family [Thermincola potens JR]KNZ68223.1 two component transcriptional regulator, winged helix family [Thermincola ferriacetica]
MNNHKVLVVDDEPKILKILEHTLKKERFQVITAQNGMEAVELAAKVSPDLVLLDLMLPDIDGFEVCRRIKSRSDIPIIVLSAKDDEVDKIVGFKLGIDDYQTKPFSPTELVLRIRAVLRRSKGCKEAANDGILTYKDIEINQRTRQVRVYGRNVNLTVKEFDLLWLLASYPNQVFSRMQLLEKIWDSSYYGDENTVTVHIRRLREKIENDPADPEFIKTIWGIGYKFEAEQ